MDNYQKLNETITNLESESKKLRSVSDALNEVAQLKDSFHKSNKELVSASSLLVDITNKLDSRLKNYDKNIADLLSLVKEIESENRSNFKNLEDHTTSKLEKHKSDIQVDIRNSGKSIELKVESSIAKGIFDLEQKINKSISELNNRTRNLSILSIIFSSLILTGLIVLIVKALI